MNIIKGILFGLLCFATAVAMMLFCIIVNALLPPYNWLPSPEIMVVGLLFFAFVSAFLGFVVAKQSKTTGQLGSATKRIIVGMLCFSLLTYVRS
jgi:hypothetical protein